MSMQEKRKKEGYITLICPSPPLSYFFSLKNSSSWRLSLPEIFTAHNSTKTSIIMKKIRIDKTKTFIALSFLCSVLIMKEKKAKREKIKNKNFTVFSEKIRKNPKIYTFFKFSKLLHFFKFKKKKLP